jgi:hypothetical protein
VQCCWLIILFAGYGLIAARNATVMVFLFACTLSVSGGGISHPGIGGPFQGLIRVSSVPLRDVITQLGQ